MSEDGKAGVVASNYVAIGKGSVLGRADLEIPAWRIKIHRCLYMLSKAGKEFVNLPRHEWTGTDGAKHYNDIITFTDDRTRQRFQQAAVDAIRAVITNQ